MIQVIALDIGGILFKPNWRLYGIQDFATRFNLSKEEVFDTLKYQREDFYTGKISEQDYWKNVINTLSIKASPADLATFYRQYITIDTEVLDLLKHLKQKFTFIACNNCPKEWMDYRVKIGSLYEIFSKFITSGYVGVMKPDTKMYNLIINKYNTDNVLYIDDNELYFKKAQMLGLRVQLFKDLSDLKLLTGDISLT